MNKEVSEGNLMNDVFKVEGVKKEAAGTRFLDPGLGLGLPTAPY